MIDSSKPDAQEHTEKSLVCILKPLIEIICFSIKETNSQNQNNEEFDGQMVGLFAEDLSLSESEDEETESLH